MRTTSADKFIDFVQNLDGDYRGPMAARVMIPDRVSENDFDQTDGGIRTPAGGSSSSIMVTEGDFLQTERIHNGIVFNVVKREDLEQPNGNHEEAECVSVTLDCPEKELDSSSESDHTDGDEANLVDQSGADDKHT
jgi:TAG lipase/steryl ester hydrolase/phospholipase A2/LPA acyltransferase